MANELAKQIDIAKWQWVRSFHERGNLFLVDRMIELDTAGERIVADDKETVQLWLASKMLYRPTAEQVATWDAAADTVFSMLVTSPFVLIQEQAEPVENRTASS